MKRVDQGIDIKRAEEQLSVYADNVWLPSALVEVRCLMPDRRDLPAGVRRSVFATPRQILNGVRKLVAWNQQGVNIYAGPMPRRAAGAMKDSDCLPGCVVWADIDRVSAAEGMRQLELFPLSPTFVLDSGHGLHAYWGLQRPSEPDQISRCVEGIARMIGGDTSVRNPSRIMRLPGFMNWKRPPALSVLLTDTPGDRYAIGVIEDICAAAAEAESAKDEYVAVPSDNGNLDKRIGSLIEKHYGGYSQGLRNEKAFQVAADLMVGYQLPENEAWEWMRYWNSLNTPALSEHELRECLKSGRSYAKGSPGYMLRDYVPVRAGRKTVPVAHDDDDEIPVDPGSSDGIIASLESRHARMESGEVRPIPMPWEQLSGMCGGLRSGEASILVSAPGNGKTWFAMALAHWANNKGVPVDYLPLEMTREQFADRALALISNDWSPVTAGGMDDPSPLMPHIHNLRETYRDDLANLMDCIHNNPMTFELQGASFKNRVVCHQKVIRWILKVGSKRKGLIVIDPASYIESNSREEWREEKKFMADVSNAAQTTGSHIMIVTHTVKNYDKLGLAAAHGSAAFTRKANIVLMLDSTGQPKTAEILTGGNIREDIKYKWSVLIAKCRSGSGAGHSIAMDLAHPFMSEIGLIAKINRGGH